MVSKHVVKVRNDGAKRLRLIGDVDGGDDGDGCCGVDDVSSDLRAAALETRNNTVYRSEWE